MSTSHLTFQKLWKVSVGQYNDGVFTTLFSTHEHKFTANIDCEATSASNTEAPQVSSISLYNLGYERIALLSGGYTLYVKIEAGFLYSGTTRNTVDALPMVYLGFIHYSYTSSDGVDVITELHCTPAFDKLARATINKEFNKGSFAKDIFLEIGRKAGIPVILNYKARDTEKLKTSKTVEGTAAAKLSEWCRKYKLKSYVDKGTLYVVDIEVKVVGALRHFIPLELQLGSAELSIDNSKILKKGVKPSPDINFNTFLYSQININDVVNVELIDYSKAPVEVGKESITRIQQEFVVTGYSHILDSGSGGSWETRIRGTGDQSNGK